MMMLDPRDLTAKRFVGQGPPPRALPRLAAETLRSVS